MPSHPRRDEVLAYAARLRANSKSHPADRARRLRPLRPARVDFGVLADDWEKTALTAAIRSWHDWKSRFGDVLTVDDFKGEAIVIAMREGPGLSPGKLHNLVEWRLNRFARKELSMNHEDLVALEMEEEETDRAPAPARAQLVSVGDMNDLTPRQREIVEGLAGGQSQSEVAQ